MKLNALYLDGQSPLEKEVIVQWIDGAWIFDDLQQSWLAHEVAIDCIEDELHVRKPSTGESLSVRRLEKSDLARFGMLAATRSPSQKRKYAGVLALATVGVFLSLYMGIRPASYRLAGLVPPHQERKYFDPLTPIAFLNESRCTQMDAQRSLQRLGNRLLEAGDAPETFEILNWKMANAFAFPGRRIYVTQGLIERMETSEQLLAVLAHEQGHVDLRHNLGETIDRMLRAFLWSMAVGDFSGVFLVDPKLAKDISEASYSREIEAEADEYGAQKLRDRGHDPKALGEALQLIAQTEAEKELAKKEDILPAYLRKIVSLLEGIFTTHPDAAVRGEILRENYPGDYRRESLKADEWRFLKGACRSREGE